MFEESLAENPASEREVLLAVDVQAEDESYTITARKPGLDTEDISVEIINKMVRRFTFPF
jgi:HSP20 family molecular chaperone IbpA